MTPLVKYWIHLQEQLARQDAELVAALANLDEQRRLKEKAEAELARVTTERDAARAIVAKVNNAVIGSNGYFTEPSCVEAIGKLKQDSNRAVNELARKGELADHLEGGMASITDFLNTELRENYGGQFQVDQYTDSQAIRAGIRHLVDCIKTYHEQRLARVRGERDKAENEIARIRMWELKQREPDCSDIKECKP